MCVIRFNEEGEVSIDVKIEKDLTSQKAKAINDFFSLFKEKIYDYDTNEAFIDAGMKKLAKKMNFKYEILFGPDFEIAI
ncbi:MAG: hypothetical protein IKP65_08785 [Alphaproteobacteria bacterium]|nr:hypothetical protein [Alphaproteobacteria bacterium]